MRYFLTIIFCLGYFNLSLAKAWDEVFERVSSSIPLIYSGGGICSGALIEKKLILTAAHCVYSFRYIHVAFRGSEKTTVKGELVAIDKKNDLALIQVTDILPRPPLEILPRKSQVKIGMEISTVGHPTFPKPFNNPSIDLDSTFLMSSGIISGVTTDDIVVDAPLSPGNSGGPLFNREGKIIGVISRKRVGGLVGDIGYATHHHRVHDLINKFKKEKTIPSVFRANHSFGMGLGYEHHDVFSDVNTLQEDSGALFFELNLWSRLQLRWTQEIENRDWDFDKYSYGYRFMFPLFNQSALLVVPGYETIEYKITRDNTLDGDGPFLALSWSSIPIEFKYSLLKVEGESEGVIAINLKFAGF